MSIKIAAVSTPVAPPEKIPSSDEAPTPEIESPPPPPADSDNSGNQEAITDNGSIRGEDAGIYGEQAGGESVEGSGVEETVSGEDIESPQELSPEEERRVTELQQIDSKVRQHEQAHAAAAGPHLRGGPTYEYTEGPDGRRYATGGSVDLDTSREDNPEETIEKMHQVRRAALAPADPSPEDYQVAQKASGRQAQARQEKAEQERENNENEETAGQIGIDNSAVEEQQIEEGAENSPVIQNQPAADNGEQANILEDIFSEDTAPPGRAVNLVA